MNTATLQDDRKRIDDYMIKSTEAIEHEELRQMSSYAVALGGKRIRPILCMLAAQMYDVPKSAVLPQAVALELFHAFSLVHDDIMDEAPLRRGRPSIYRKHGRDRAILSGDVIMMLAYKLLLRDLPATKADQVLQCFTDMAVKVCEGQMMDMDFEQPQFPTREAYMKMIKYKTSVLIGAALKIGALVAGAPKDDCDRLYSYGVLQGLVFQIQDDLLDVYGEECATGKQEGGDIVQGKKSLLTVLYAQKSDVDCAGFENVFYDQHMAPDQKVKWVKAAYAEAGVQQEAVMLKNTLAQQADEVLSDLSIGKQKAQPLIDLCRWLMDRSH